MVRTVLPARVPLMLLLGLTTWELPPAAADAKLPSPEQRKRIEAAIPKTAPAKPLKPRRLLSFDLNVGYGGHGSIVTANYAFRLMGQRTGAFETIISRDPAVFRPESLRQFDAVFFNNTVGNCFRDPALRRSLVEFVYAGGGLMGVHGTSVAFTRWTEGAREDWPEFASMLGARGASHLDANEPVLVRVEDAAHPVTACFGGKAFEYRSEFFRFNRAYSRHRVRVLLSMDNVGTAKLQGKPAVRRFRPDDDYAIAWVRNYGRGRVFYSSLAHSPNIFWDPKMLELYLAATQFALGDLPAATAPSAALTPALRAQEKLGWRPGVEAYTFHKYTLFETIDKTAQLGLPYVGGLSFQTVSKEMPKRFTPKLTDEELKQVRLKLDAAGVRMLTYYYQSLPADEAACRKVFDFARKMGIETFMSEPAPAALDTIEKLCDEYDIKVAIHNHGPKSSPIYWQPEGVLKVCQGRSKRLGACGDMGYWMRAGIDPIEAIRKLGHRLITIQMHDLNDRSPTGHDVPWGTGAGKTALFLKEMHKLGIKPVMVGLEYSYDWTGSMPECAQCMDFLNKLSLELTPGDGQ